MLIVGVFIFILVIAISVGLHEASHMAAAKLLKIKVPEFFIGFGHKIWSFKRNGTEYGLRWIPMGGYVRIVDESVPEGEVERELLSNVKPWKRQLIFGAGATANVLIGSLILVLTIYAFPFSQPSNLVKSVTPCSAGASCGASDVGIMPGDRIIGINGTDVKTVAEFGVPLSERETADIDVLRNGSEIHFKDTPVSKGKIGVVVKNEEVENTFGEAVSNANDLVFGVLKGVARIPGQLPGVVESLSTGKRAEDAPGSIIGAGSMYGEVASTHRLTLQEKVRTWLMFTGGINLSLGFVNFLPLLPLDGGRMFIALLDSIKGGVAKIRRRAYFPTPYSIVRWLTIIPGSVVVGVMILLLLSDIVAPVKLLP